MAVITLTSKIYMSLGGAGIVHYSLRDFQYSFLMFGLVLLCRSIVQDMSKGYNHGQCTCLLVSFLVACGLPYKSHC